MFFSEKLRKISNINHFFFSRNNGHSKDIYDSLNCGIGSNDDKKNVIKNLKFVSSKLNIKDASLKLMHQTHSNRVIVVNKKNEDKTRFNSDALITNVKGLGLGVLTADCVPIILYDIESGFIGCIHAGWKGLVTNIIKNTIDELKKFSVKNKIIASVGPCIGFKSYEVEVDFYKKFVAISKNNQIFFSKKNDKKFLFNIRAYANNELTKYGAYSIDNVEYDTFIDSSNFYSYRRSQKLGERDYGRSISAISLI